MSGRSACAKLCPTSIGELVARSLNMRRTMILGIVAMFGGATQNLHADDADTLDRRIEMEQGNNRAAAKGLDIDYQLCAAVVIADAIKDLASTDTVYLSFIGED